ncbi:hypothetical protein ACLMJK_005697 [Lecanora helva]
MSLSSAVTATWSISSSTADALSISKGAIVAATSDNIQIIALLACEGFGATLPMCPESCAKAHQLCSRAHESTTLSFLKAKIGFQRGDSGWQLSQSDAGLRFLALAACLLTIDWWKAAELLRKLVTSTAEDKRLVPTSQQIKQLLIAINYRLACSGFANQIIGWKAWIEELIGSTPLEINTPPSNLLFQLVSALSKLERLGETESVHVETPVADAAWIIAFIKWCLGEPPILVLSNDPSSIIQSESRVHLHLMRDLSASPASPTKIWTQDTIGSINDLWSDHSVAVGDFNGMVHLPELAARLMAFLGPKTWLEYRAGREAISLGCLPVLEHFMRIGSRDGDEMPNISVSQGSLFSDEEVIARTLAGFLGESPESSLKALPKNTLVEDLPSIETVKKKFKKTCRCGKCLNDAAFPKQKCTFDRYMRTISKCIATVLLASLLVSNAPEGVFLHLPVSTPDVFDDFTTAVYHCLRDSGQQSCSTDSIIDEVLKLVGRRDERRTATKDWIMSVHQGQTIYPQILNSLSLHKIGLLSLICVQGLIIYKGEKYDYVEVSEKLNLYPSGRRRSQDLNTSDEVIDSDDDFNDDPLLARNRIIQEARDEYQDSKIIWKVSAKDDRLFLSVHDPSHGSFASGERHPIRAIWAASKSFFVTCPHDRQLPLSKPNPWLVAAQPGFPPKRRRSEARKRGVVLTDRNERDMEPWGQNIGTKNE